MPEVESAALMGWALCAAWAYLLGSFPTAFVVGRWMRGQDIRTLGDGNIGAGNAGRLWGARIGLLVGAVDVCKGVTAVLVVWWVLDAPEGPMLAGILAILETPGPFTSSAVVGGAEPLLAEFCWLSSPGLRFRWDWWLLLCCGSPGTLPSLWRPTTYRSFSWPSSPIYMMQNWAAYALAVPVLVGVIHFLSLRRELRIS